MKKSIMILIMVTTGFLCFGQQDSVYTGPLNSARTKDNLAYAKSDLLDKVLTSLLVACISTVLNLHLLDFSIELSHALGKFLLLIPHERALAGEQEVYLLKRAAGSLGEETVYDGDVREHGGAEDVEGLTKKKSEMKIWQREDRTNLLVDTGKHDRDQHRPSAVADRPTRNTEGVTLGAQPCRKNLGRINKRNHQPRGAEDNHVDEDHGGGSGSVLFSLVGVINGATVQTTTGRNQQEQRQERNGFVLTV